jgi:hypothetical protein
MAQDLAFAEAAEPVYRERRMLRNLLVKIEPTLPAASKMQRETKLSLMHKKAGCGPSKNNARLWNEQRAVALRRKIHAIFRGLKKLHSKTDTAAIYARCIV